MSVLGAARSVPGLLMASLVGAGALARQGAQAGAMLPVTAPGPGVYFLEMDATAPRELGIEAIRYSG
jgi:hypothetical protein